MTGSPGDEVGMSSSDDPVGNAKVVIVVCLVLFFGVLNTSGVTVILPEMGAAFSVTTIQLSWVMTGYMLTYGIAIPFFGKLADKFGARPLFFLCIALFSIGSMACLVAPTFETMLAARILQSCGGAAFAGLGLAIASRAFPPQKRGIVLGTVSATVGVGSAAGPLVAGIATELVHWRAIFGISGLVIFLLPLAYQVLPQDDERSEGPLDVMGGMFLAAAITGLLLAVSQSVTSGWFDPAVLIALAFSTGGATGWIVRQRTSSAPFIATELMENGRYLRLIALAFLSAAVYLAALLGFPLMLASQNGLDTLQIGFVMLPGAIAMGLGGVLAGRLVDQVGPRLPTRLGVGLMLGTMLSLSLLSGGSAVSMAILGALLGSGFSLLNTSVTAIIAVMVRPATLASALSINTMAFFVGGSLGAALFSAVVTVRADAVAAWNPLYNGSAINYSDAFGTLAVVVLLALVLVVPLPTKKMVDAARVEKRSRAETFGR
jgi:DHA2 family metal-tetracycline-proton antiporter-like MFS transporter